MSTNLRALFILFPFFLFGMDGVGELSLLRKSAYDKKLWQQKCCLHKQIDYIGKNYVTLRWQEGKQDCIEQRLIQQSQVLQDLKEEAHYPYRILMPFNDEVRKNFLAVVQGEQDIVEEFSRQDIETSCTVADYLGIAKTQDSAWRSLAQQWLKMYINEEQGIPTAIPSQVRYFLRSMYDVDRSLFKIFTSEEVYDYYAPVIDLSELGLDMLDGIEKVAEYAKQHKLIVRNLNIKGNKLQWLGLARLRQLFPKLKVVTADNNKINILLAEDVNVISDLRVKLTENNISGIQSYTNLFGVAEDLELSSHTGIQNYDIFVQQTVARKLTYFLMRYLYGVQLMIPPSYIFCSVFSECAKGMYNESMQSCVLYIPTSLWFGLITSLYWGFVYHDWHDRVGLVIRQS